MSNKESKIIGKIYGEGDVVEIKVKDGLIHEILKVTSPSKSESNQIILPGLVDLHCHLREPGSEASETIETGSKAAAAGGFTCVFAMANTIPVSDTASSVETTFNKGKEVGLVDVQPIGAVTRNLEGKKLSDMAKMHSSLAKVTVFSDDGKCVSDPLVMRRALEYISGFGGVLAQHAQDPRLTENAQMNEGAFSAKLGLQGWPGVAEESIIARDILLAMLTGSKLHICHLSTSNSVEIVRFAKRQLKIEQERAKKAGDKDAKILKTQITAEVTPHHLTLCENMLNEYNPRYKVNPPLRTQSDIEALKLGVKDGTIDIVATDHAPHALELKYCNFQDSAFGMTGLETALGAVQLALIDAKLISWRDVARLLSETPAKIGSVSDFQGRPLKVGEPANICVYDPTSKSQNFDPETSLSRSKNTPFKHFEIPGKIISTYLRGKQTYQYL